MRGHLLLVGLLDQKQSIRARTSAMATFQKVQWKSIRKFKDESKLLFSHYSSLIFAYFRSRMRKRRRRLACHPAWLICACCTCLAIIAALLATTLVLIFCKYICCYHYQVAATN